MELKIIRLKYFSSYKYCIECCIGDKKNSSYRDSAVFIQVIFALFKRITRKLKTF